MLVTLGASPVTLGGAVLSFGPVAPSTFRRGDDAGARERFWQAKAEEWLGQRLKAVERAAQRPKRARKKAASRIAADLSDFLIEVPSFSPRVDALAELVERLSAPTVDYSEIAAAVQAQMDLVAAWNTRQRRRRDMDALLILAA